MPKTNKGLKYHDRHANRRLIAYFLRRRTEAEVVHILKLAGYEVEKLTKV